MSIIILLYTALRDTLLYISLAILHLPIYLRHPSLILIDCLSFFHYFINRNAYFKDESELTYGELSYYSFRKLIKTLDLPPSAHLTDFGSGKGKLCFYGTLLGFQCQGIEINNKFHAFSNYINTLFFKKKVIFRCENFIQSPLNETDVLLISPLCLSTHTLTSLSKKELPSTLHIFSIAAPYPGLTITKQIPCLTSWGITVCYYHSVSQNNEFRS